MDLSRSEAKELFKRAFQRAVEEVSPKRAIEKFIQRDRNNLRIGGQIFQPQQGRLFVVGFGKASAAMAAEIEEIAGDLLFAGAVVTKYDHGVPLSRIKLFEAAHPVPDEAGVQATAEILSLLDQTRENDLVLTLISGGGSALLVHPRPGLTLEEKQEITHLLLSHGVPIEKMNVVRKHLSLVKGGQLARRAAPARVVSLIISDVIGDRLEAIASGPTAPDPSTFEEAERILRDFDIWPKLSESFRDWFLNEKERPEAETPKPGDPLFDRVENHIIAGNFQALLAAEQEFRNAGWKTLILSSCVQGEAREIARFWGAVAKDLYNRNLPIPRPACILAGGETTVTLTGNGKGGRNTEMALAILPDLAEVKKAAFFSAGTDGTDGPTDAAGAFAFSDSLTRAEEKRLDARQYLRNNDSYNFFRQLGDLFVSGATGTNVMDLQILLVP